MMVGILHARLFQGMFLYFCADNSAASYRFSVRLELLPQKPCFRHPNQYYDVYAKQLDKLFDKAKELQVGFNTFISDLDICIGNAARKVDYWDAKRKEREWVSTDD